jgi:phospholipase/lecithinase/hemolysin
VETAVSNVTGVLQQLHAAGASNFVVANLPDLGATPFARGETSIPFNPPPGDNRLALSFATQAYNQLLSQTLVSLPFVVTLIDVEQLLALVLQNAAALGFDNLTDPCLDLTTLASACGSPNRYLFWDEVHPTSQAHAILSGVFVQAIPEPATLLLLLAGLVWLHRFFMTREAGAPRNGRRN